VWKLNWYSAIGISIGGKILISELISQVPKYTSTVSPQAVVQAGALNLDTLASSPSTLTGLREAYSAAISGTMICATVTICVSVLTTFGMRWFNLKHVSKDNEQVTDASEKKETRAWERSRVVYYHNVILFKGSFAFLLFARYCIDLLSECNTLEWILEKFFQPLASRTWPGDTVLVIFQIAYTLLLSHLRGNSIDVLYDNLIKDGMWQSIIHILSLVIVPAFFRSATSYHPWSRSRISLSKLNSDSETSHRLT